jgi:hypothetical protein
MRHFKTILTVIGAVTVLVLAANTAAFAATGGKFVLGHKNKASKVSTLKRTTNGPALNLVTKSSSSAPFTANGLGKVTNLNADRVDGYDSSQMLNSTMTFTKSLNLLAPATSFGLTSSTIPAGTYLVTGSAWVYGPSAAAGIECQIDGTGTSTARWSWLPGNPDGYYTPDLTGLITLTGAQTVQFECHSGPSYNWQTFNGAPLQLTLTKVAAPVTGTATRVAPGADRVSPSTR